MKWPPFTLIFATLYAAIIVWFAIDTQHVLDGTRAQANPSPAVVVLPASAVVLPAALARPQRPSQVSTHVMEAELDPAPNRSATTLARREKSSDEASVQMVTEPVIDHRPTPARAPTVVSAQRAGRGEPPVPPDELARETEKTTRESAMAFEALRAMAAKQ